ncbi:MAG: hypothetical protein WCA08_01005, partial [Desulfoferrobacter sp.]
MRRRIEGSIAARCDDLRRESPPYDEVLQFQGKNGLLRCRCKSVSDIVVGVSMTMRRIERLKVRSKI